MTLDPTSATKTPDPLRPVVPEYTVIVAVRGQDDTREFLMVKHTERGWELPGGKFEGKEGPVHCALREFREETGHLLSDPKFVIKLHKENGVCFVFTGGLGTAVAEVEPREHITGFKWFKRLPPAAELGFPDDPYEIIGEKIGVTFR